MASGFSFQTKVTSVFAALLAIVLLIAFAVVYKVITDSTFRQIESQLSYSRNAVDHQLAERMDSLRESTQILARDFGFRKAVATGDIPTIKSVSDNFSTRTEASRIMVADLNGQLLADTQLTDADRGQALQEHLRNADKNGIADGMLVLDGTVYQFAIAPIQAPDPVGYLVVAKALDIGFIRKLQSSLPGNIDISFLARNASHSTSLITSTLTDIQRAALIPIVTDTTAQPSESFQATLDGIDYVLGVQDINARHPEMPVQAVLQYSLTVALAPYKPLYLTLLAILAGGLVFGILGAHGVSRSVIRPLLTLVQATLRIKAGHYDAPVTMRQRDEIGQLADAFNLMMQGIAEREEHIQRQAEYDALTGLPNRRYVDSRLPTIATACLDDERGFSALLVCIERYSEINSTLGHEVGDKLIHAIGRKLLGAVKSTDTVARIGSDTFAAIVLHTGPEEIPGLAERMLALFEAPFKVDGITIDVSAHIGAACYPEHTEEPCTLLRRADRAAYTASDTLARFALYDPRSDTSKKIRLSLMGELRDALANDGFMLHYQPQIDIRSQRLMRVEALIRWEHPDLGFLPPDQFVPLAERTGDIHRLTHWVLDQGIRQLAAWSRRGLDIGMSINLSAKDLLDRHLPQKLAALLETHGVAAQRLMLEITESALMQQPEHALGILQSFRDMGVDISVDDFGTGYSSLTYLSRFPVSELKIDKSFVMHMDKNPQDLSIVHSVIDLGHRLSLQVVSEGVEHDALLEQLKSLDCDLAQGYGIARPMAAADFEVWIGRNYPDLLNNKRPILVADNTP
ncbi:MAG: EAL domain-containing protein [Gammaproteobacteria bacterium]|nr:EAL domain-containing protein [Gammaproteobacteria bacterium]